MAKLIKGEHVVETTVPNEVTALKSRGYKVVEAAKPAAPVKK